MSGDIFDDQTAEEKVVMRATGIQWVEVSDAIIYPIKDSYAQQRIIQRMPTVLRFFLQSTDCTMQYLLYQIHFPGYKQKLHFFLS